MSAARSSTNPNRARKEADICDPRLIVEGPFSDSVRVEANRVFRIGGHAHPNRCERVLATIKQPANRLSDRPAGSVVSRGEP
jgi:hypothetical protein